MATTILQSAGKVGDKYYIGTYSIQNKTLIFIITAKL
jgi:hypothetical protein